MMKHFSFLQKCIIIYNPKTVIIWTFVLHPSHISWSKINLTGSMSQINLMIMTDILLNISYQFIFIFVRGGNMLFRSIYYILFTCQVSIIKQNSDNQIVSHNYVWDTLAKLFVTPLCHNQLIQRKEKHGH